ncbi:hypothetical protein QTH87_13150 [Variovorax sp. J22P168]|uniref:hypothetical protein n=1 Tax=Variovorax jilinensis TaxID=3053513 RepID=UPI0025777BF5|nr:hypothetical protein [Variovorax sp. J22P168]MDM0013383.1 hypothetical protein [Variovorax sp. J22P168]
MSTHDLILLAVQASILITVFGSGLEATVDDVLFVGRRPSLFLQCLIAMFVVMPLLALLLDKVFDLLREIDIVSMALAWSPVPPLLR